ncbi:hypothetical protein Cabther_A1980 [Chloracidobacterium thermophilum B]|uniref:Uncharacterized protein n=1 Tax=Chloracidobacterium thermophilum (strain B) TaxID=981222 RepID=G2LIV7_CHLTF|nr:hypothetical protein Cabther_A1980 [Chloracidobacterium thermophilum B]
MPRGVKPGRVNELAVCVAAVLVANARTARRQSGQTLEK